MGRPRPNPHKETGWTGIGKQPTLEAVKVRAPGPKTSGLGSGLVGDFIGDGKHHGGDSQAVYAFQREDLDEWERRLGRELPSGFFGENLTTEGIDVDNALIGERWKISSTVLEVTAPRIPCSTLASRMGDTKFVKSFAAGRRPGAYFRIIEPGELEAGDEIEVVSRPDHEVTIKLVNEARLHDKSLISSLAPAVDQLSKDFREMVLAAS